MKRKSEMQEAGQVVYLTFDEQENALRYDKSAGTLHMSAVAGRLLFKGNPAVWRLAVAFTENGIGWVPFEDALAMHPDEKAETQYLLSSDDIREIAWNKIKNAPRIGGA